MASKSIEQHNAEIHENLVHWNRKQLLGQVYQEFYREIGAQITNRPPGPVVECGSGIGNLKSTVPDAIATDIFPNPWLDQLENVYSLSFPDSSVSALIMFDVFHHLEYPGAALDEVFRVLRPGGRIVIFEPGMGVLGRVFLGLFHHEPLGLAWSITWTPPAGWNPSECRYYAAQGNAWRIFVKREFLSEIAPKWTISVVRPVIALRWLMVGGFRGPQLLKPWMQPCVALVERLLSRSSRFFASRLLVVLEKPCSP